MTNAATPPTVPGLTGLTVLARGGYATVYRAVQESIGRDVAVKVENRTLENDRDRQRFMREARAAGRMSSHPHVVDLFDAGMTAEGHPYLIMELCDGSYAERMRSAPLSPEEAREVGYKIADALADGHSLGVLHRDVKPANILFSNFGEPALADFGLAILAEWRDVSITLDVLTPAYAPPEAFRQAHPTPAGDVYALCATLYALMRGRPPRWRDDRAPSLASLVDMFAERVPDLPGVPPEMMSLLRAGMANDENARPTAIDLRDALQAMRFGPAPMVLIPPLGSPPLPPLGAHDVTVPHAAEQTVRHGIAVPASSGSSSPPGAGPASGGVAGAGAGAAGAGPAGGGVAGGEPAGNGAAGYGAAGYGAGSGSLVQGGAAQGSAAGEGAAGRWASSSDSAGGLAAGGVDAAGSRPAGGVATGGGVGSGSPGGGDVASGGGNGAGYAFVPGHPQPAVVGALVPSPPVWSPSRRFLWFALAVCGFALVAIVAVTAAYARTGAAQHQVFKTPAAASSQSTGPATGSPAAAATTPAAPTPSATGSAGTLLGGPGCGPLAPSGVTCSGHPDCYDAAKHQVTCNGRHTWEAFAVGQLPAGVPPTAAIHDSGVLQACSRITLLSVAPQTATGFWQIDVLTPTGSSRTYRCLAGRGPDALVGAQLTRK